VDRWHTDPTAWQAIGRTEPGKRRR